MSSLAQLQLMRLVSPSLPVGGFAYSQGLEYAIENGWVNNPNQLNSWISGCLDAGLACLDIPMLAALYRALAEQDYAKFECLNLELIASRETLELELEDVQMGNALRTLLNQLDANITKPLSDEAMSWTSMFALAGVHWQVELNQLADGYLWTWLENQLAVAGKTLPLGQTACQKLLSELLPKLPTARESGLALPFEQISGSLPALSLASTLHETQYCRLFRS
ncbi:urease accessory protein UreF [Agarivorans sp. MS3-6]|uniref:urease accessory protein UreF n=1 Tax=Agarivorans sp. TSD2052 TaxID=2937286 RepID=UPI00200C15D8|nr:urease accessory UreF family protein [Agarivorans sp. TSD2052]UPW18442.1 urease accessory protein UreF [Agarivorans sp. TSD2052]